MNSTWYEGLQKKRRNKLFNHAKDRLGDSSCAVSTTLPPVSPKTEGASEAITKSSSAPALGANVVAARKAIAARQKAFADRQLNHASVDVRRSMSAIQRDFVHGVRATDDVEFWGAKGVPGFRTYLEKKYGSIVAGWRAIDEDKNGRLSFYEFCNACRKMGYHGNIKKLWKELDVNCSGFVSLSEIDPKVGHAVGTFKAKLVKTYGDVLTAWRKGLDTNGTGRIEERELEECCEKIGYKEVSTHRLYNMLKCGPGGAGMTLMEFDPDAWRRLVTSDLEGLTSKTGVEFTEDVDALEDESKDITARHSISGGAKQFRAKLVEKERADIKEELEKNYRFRLGLHTVAGFKQALTVRCGSLLGAWRHALDLDENGRLSFGEFCLALQRLGFHGDVQGLWKDLGGRKKGYLLFKDLDPATDAAFEELREKMKEKYGNMLLAWIKGLDTSNNGSVDKNEFIAGCAQVGFSGDAEKLFDMLKPEAGRSCLSLEDFDVKAYNAQLRGDFRMVSEKPDGEKKHPKDMTFEERQQSGFAFQVNKSFEAAKREEFAKACRLAKPPDISINTSEEFAELCKRKHGSIIGAWRNCLDSDQNGKLTFNEFCEAVRRLGYGGDLQALWKKYGGHQKGHLVLKDLHEESHVLVTTFLQLLADKFGNLDKAWRTGFKKDPHDSIDEKTLVEACKALGYQHDGHKLFRCLQPVPGRQLITIWDLDPLCSRKRARGESAEMSETTLSPKSLTKATTKYMTIPKSPESHPERKRLTFGEKEGEQDNASVSNQASRQKPFATTGNMLDLVPMSQLFRQNLKKKYGSTVAAWRTALDPHGQGCVFFGRLSLTLDEIGFKGNVMSLWQELTGKRIGNKREATDPITFKDLDPESHEVLELARSQLVEKSGSLIQAWKDELDPANSGLVDEKAFETACTSMALDCKAPASKLFKLLLPHDGSRSISEDDLEALLIGMPPKEKDKLRGCPASHVRATTAPPVRPENLPKNWTTERATKKWLETPRAAVCNLIKDHESQDQIINSIESFKSMCVVKFGSLFAAWRHGLDEDHNGVITQKDFASVCRKLGVKSIRELWTQLDANKDGQLTLNEIDAELYEAFSQFETLLVEKYGSTKEGWRKCFDYDRRMRCRQERFVEACNELGYTGDAAKLFEMLRPEPGRPYLAYGDLWLNLNPNDFQHRKEGLRDSVSPIATSRQSPKGESEKEETAASQFNGDDDW